MILTEDHYTLSMKTSDDGFNVTVKDFKIVVPVIGRWLLKTDSFVLYPVVIFICVSPMNYVSHYVGGTVGFLDPNVGWLE